MLYGFRLFRSLVDPLHILVFDPVGITPELFQVVKPPGLRVKDVHDRIEVIHTDPLRMLHTFDMAGAQGYLVAQPPLDIAGNTSHLRGRIAFAHDEEVHRGIIYRPEVQQHDIFSLNVCDTIDDQILKAVGNGFVLNSFLSPYQMFSPFIPRG